MTPIYIINFNTTELTNNCIRSIIKNLHNFDYQINVFDNSNARRFKCADDISIDVNIINNYCGKIIEFNDVLRDSVDIDHCAMTKSMNTSRFGTLKHTYTIYYIIEHETRPFILFDSDTELLKDIDFIDDQYATIACIDYLAPKYHDRLLPFIQYFNTPLIKQNNIKYFDKNRILFGACAQNNLTYDTGASFLEDIRKKNIPYKEINYSEYVNHISGGSFNRKNYNIPTVTIGEYSYGMPKLIGDDSGSKLKIGKFCSISS